jgi:hypothetical protein
MRRIFNEVLEDAEECRLLLRRSTWARRTVNTLRTVAITDHVRLGRETRLRPRPRHLLPRSNSTSSSHTNPACAGYLLQVLLQAYPYPIVRRTLRRVHRRPRTVHHPCTCYRSLTACRDTALVQCAECHAIRVGFLSCQLALTLVIGRLRREPVV